MWSQYARVQLLDRTGDTTSGEFNQPEYATDQFPVGSTMERKITLGVYFVDGSALTSLPVLVRNLMRARGVQARD